MEWRYGMNDVWGFEDLSDAERAFAEEQGCEAGKKYYGDPVNDHDVAQCPFCGRAIWAQTCCPHLVFRYANGPGEYFYINPSFERHFWARIVPSLEGELCDYLQNLVNECSSLAELQPADILDIVDDIQLYESQSFSGDTSEVCGFLAPEIVACFGSDTSAEPPAPGGADKPSAC